MADTAPSQAPAVTIGDPAPLGLAGFGLTTLILSIVNAGWFGNAVIVPLTSSTLSMAVAYGGLAQFTAGLWAFRKGNTFAGTAFCSYGAFWFSFFLLVQLYVPVIVKGAPDATLGWVGLYLLAWGIFTAYMTVASLGGASKAVTYVFILLTLTFVALAIGWFAGGSLAAFVANADGWITLGGYLGILTAIAALYASFADVANASFKRVVLPVGKPFAAG